MISTWKYKDEKGTDSSDDTDNFTDVWYKHSNEQRRHYPENRQNPSAATFKLHHQRLAPSPPPAQKRVLNHWSDVFKA